MQQFGGELPRTKRRRKQKADAPLQLVFPYFTGNPIDSWWFRRHVWNAVLKAAGVPRIRIHDIRHTFASLLLQNGESLAYVKDQLGHASIQTTVDVYGHLVPGDNRSAVNRLDDPEGAPALKVAG